MKRFHLQKFPSSVQSAFNSIILRSRKKQQKMPILNAIISPSSYYSFAAGGISSSSFSLSSSSLMTKNDRTCCISKRYYFHDISVSKIPPDAHFPEKSSSSSPSERWKIIQEYCLSPIFSSQSCGVCIGSLLSPRQFAKYKPRIRKAIAEVLMISEQEVALGLSLQLLQVGGFESCRFRSQRYANMSSPDRGEKVAETLCEVFFPDDWSVEEVVTHGLELEAIIMNLHHSDSEENGEGNLSKMGGENKEEEKDSRNKRMKKEKDEREKNRHLLASVGITYAEPPPHDPAPFFTAIDGQVIPPAEIQAAKGRWIKRYEEVKEELKNGKLYADMTEDEWMELMLWGDVDAESEPTSNN